MRPRAKKVGQKSRKQSKHYVFSGMLLSGILLSKVCFRAYCFRKTAFGHMVRAVLAGGPASPPPDPPPPVIPRGASPPPPPHPPFSRHQGPKGPHEGPGPHRARGRAWEGRSKNNAPPLFCFFCLLIPLPFSVSRDRAARPQGKRQQIIFLLNK